MLKIKSFFRWYDLWVGVYIDWPKRTVYICPLPTIGVKISLASAILPSPPDETCSICGLPMNIKTAHGLGEWEGWYTAWNCKGECGDGMLMEWPFPDGLLVTRVDLEQAGFVVS